MSEDRLEKALHAMKEEPVDAATLEDRMTIEDPVAFTRPWTVVRRFVKRPEADTRLYDFSCLEKSWPFSAPACPQGQFYLWF